MFNSTESYSSSGSDVVEWECLYQGVAIVGSNKESRCRDGLEPLLTQLFDRNSCESSSQSKYKHDIVGGDLGGLIMDSDGGMLPLVEKLVLKNKRSFSDIIVLNDESKERYSIFDNSLSVEAMTDKFMSMVDVSENFDGIVDPFWKNSLRATFRRILILFTFCRKHNEFKDRMLGEFVTDTSLLCELVEKSNSLSGACKDMEIFGQVKYYIEEVNGLADNTKRIVAALASNILRDFNKQENKDFQKCSTFSLDDIVNKGKIIVCQKYKSLYDKSNFFLQRSLYSDFQYTIRKRIGGLNINRARTVLFAAPEFDKICAPRFDSEFADKIGEAKLIQLLSFDSIESLKHNGLNGQSVDSLLSRLKHWLVTDPSFFLG